MNQNKAAVGGEAAAIPVLLVTHIFHKILSIQYKIVNPQAAGKAHLCVKQAQPKILA